MQKCSTNRSIPRGKIWLNPDDMRDVVTITADQSEMRIECGLVVRMMPVFMDMQIGSIFGFDADADRVRIECLRRCPMVRGATASPYRGAGSRPAPFFASQRPDQIFEMRELWPPWPHGSFSRVGSRREERRWWGIGAIERQTRTVRASSWRLNPMAHRPARLCGKSSVITDGKRFAT